MCLKRFKESRSRWIYPAFPEHGNVFYGAWGIASTSRKTIRSTKAEWMVFAFVHTDALLATTISVSSLPKCLAYLPLDYSAIFSIIKKKGEKT